MKAEGGRGYETILARTSIKLYTPCTRGPNEHSHEAMKNSHTLNHLTPDHMMGASKYTHTDIFSHFYVSIGRRSAQHTKNNLRIKEGLPRTERGKTLHEPSPHAHRAHLASRAAPAEHETPPPPLTRLCRRSCHPYPSPRSRPRSPRWPCASSWARGGVSSPSYATRRAEVDRPPTVPRPLSHGGKTAAFAWR